MFCKKCGAALPSHGFICKSCGAMMDMEQIKEQKEHIKNNNNNEINLLSDKYSREPINRNYEKHKEYKFIGALVIVLILFILIILAIIKVI
ncbi:MAG: hypothetical protein NC483_01500 [Ruminococcus sp.]|nr:hypothetical protein [Ruminococcus sp.]